MFLLAGALALGLALTAPAHASDAAATRAIQKAISDAVALLKNPEYTGQEKTAVRREKLRELLYSHFDFATMSRGALGASWAKFSAEQQQRFTHLFRRLLEESYLDKIEGYEGKGVEFAAERKLSDYVIELDSSVDAAGQTLKVVYRCFKNAEGWKVFDIVFEGVSLIGNYQPQFAHLMRGGDAEFLLEKLSKKVKSIDAASAG
ncbi:ABC transporter substrate-binding protein [Magnetofaba australis]|uniref:Putative toluene tolerance family protein n=1 Tax=Magnetofaba australis IT-1 TaxID=1434232 RepID=A0A1Y2K323_9PROT|nr:ABC transporter substrate-binding protein [Magnetofaba australis]OSM02359.1 putative toluene tolerance family protein [Magnetofaba australis IT-1]